MLLFNCSLWWLCTNLLLSLRALPCACSCRPVWYRERRQINFFLGSRIKEGQGSHSGPGAKPTVQSRSPDFAYSHATVNIDFYRKKIRLCYYCYGWVGGKEVTTCSDFQELFLLMYQKNFMRTLNLQWEHVSCQESFQSCKSHCLLVTKKEAMKKYPFMFWHVKNGGKKKRITLYMYDK